MLVQDLGRELVKCLPCKSQEWSSIPRIHFKNAGLGSISSEPCDGEKESGESLGLTVQASERPCLKVEREE